MADYKILTIPFARDAVPDMVNDIPETPSPSEPQLASYRQGFPVITTIRLTAGGVPPEGQDFNGILRDITEHIVHQNKGGMYKFAPEVVAAGGYAKGAVLAANDGLSLWVSLQNNNVQDFNSGTPTQWARIAFSGQDVDALLNTKADKAVSINAGTGLTGGGNLSADRTLSVSYGTTAGTAAQGNDTRIVNAVPNSRQVVAGTGLTGGGDLTENRTLSVNYGTTAGTAAQGNDSRLSDAREWTAETVSQAEAEAGTATTRRAWTAQRVAQAVRGTVLTGLSTASAAAVAASDSVLSALGKLQAQVTGLSNSKLDATANAVSATKLQTARTIALSGGVTGSGSFDGSANVSITATVASDSHTHDTRYPVLSAERVLADVPAGSWVTIAQSPVGRAYGEFIVYDVDANKHNLVKIIASHSFGRSVVVPVGGNRYNVRTIAHVRVLYSTVDRTYGGAKLQVYIENTCTLRVRALMINQIDRWDTWSEMTPVAEGTPAGWAEDTNTRHSDITNPQWSAPIIWL